MRPALPNDIAETVERALAEDVGSGDLTAGLISKSARAEAEVNTRVDAVLCGCAWFDETFRQVDERVKITWNAHDGDEFQAGQALCSLRGPTRAVLTGERAALNFLQMLSGTASRTRAYVRAVKGTRAIILDTRKTIPGLRLAQKYAVACGGGANHRMGLYDAVLIKENHIAAAGSVTAALVAARDAASGVMVEIEVEDLEQLREALQAGARRILLDNFDIAALRAAVDVARGKAELEASGGINLANVRSVAETGVDFISVGDLTKDVSAVDLSLRLRRIN